MISAGGILLITLSYFVILILFSFFTGKDDSNETFFTAKRQSPWYVVAFGMIGATLSGVTFVSVPGWVEDSQMGYFQVVLGYVVGYFIIGKILLPLYYRLNLTSIYTYLESRYGYYAYKTGSVFFLISRIVGAGFRLFLVANILQFIVFDSLEIPFWITVIITILLIWLYTFRSGIKTIVWTDTLQTFLMLTAVVIALLSLTDTLKIDTNLITFITESSYSKIFFFDDIKHPQYFFKTFFSGIFIAIVMTGLDQDMMQKNLTCKTLKDAQKNIFFFTIVLVVVNFLFLILGVLLTSFAVQNNIDAKGDMLFPIIAKNHLGYVAFLMFLIGLVASAYSSADSALTSLTTSFCVDILNIKGKTYKSPKRIRKQTHVLISIILALVILSYKYIIQDESVISKLFLFAGYTYGPLLGLYSFGLLNTQKVIDRHIPILALSSPIIGYIISEYLLLKYAFNFGFFILILNGFIMYMGLQTSYWILKYQLKSKYESKSR